MRNNTRFFVSSFIALALIFSSKISLACSVSYPPTADQPCLAYMADGADPDSVVSLRVRTDWLRRSGYEFGYMSGDVFSSLSSGRRDRQLVSFDSGALVDFALRDPGSDGVSGTPDDVLYRLSDGEASVFQYYSNPIRVRGRQAVDNPVYRRLTIAWDTDQDGIADLSAMLKVRGDARPRYGSVAGSGDGIFCLPAAAPVPVPGALWLLGSGVLGLSVFMRRHRRI